MAKKPQGRTLFKLALTAFLVGQFPQFAKATDQRYLVYNGRIANGAGQAVVGTVQFQVQITDTLGTCVMWQETQTQTLTTGVFVLQIGSGTIAFDGGGTGKLDTIFAQGAAINCQGSTPTPNVTPAINDNRNLSMSFNDGTGWQSLPSQVSVNSVPFSMFAENAVKFGGYAISTTPTNGQTLIFNSGAGLWVPTTAAGSGTVTSVSSGTGLTGGPITATGTLSLAPIASETVLANVTGGSTTPTSTTLTSLIDNAIGNTQGSVLYRNGTGWVTLAPGNSGQYLQTQGAAANPQWATVTAGVASVTGTANEITASTTLGAVTLSTPQAIATSSSPTFAGLTLSALSNGAVSSASGVLSAGTLSVANGGTAATAFGANRIVIGNGTGAALTYDACSTGNVLQFNGTSWACVSVSSLTSGTSFAQGGNAFAAAGTLGTTDSNPLNIITGNLTQMSIGATGDITLTPAADTSGVANKFLYTQPADTGLTASTEAIVENWNNAAATRTHATGALTLQRDFVISGATDAFVGASTITNSATFGLGYKSAGTNATTTYTSALYIPTAVISGTVTNSYGLNVAAASGATNNYAAAFTGKVGIGTTAPATTLDVQNYVNTAYTATGAAATAPTGAAMSIGNNQSTDSSGAFLFMNAHNAVTTSNSGYVGVVSNTSPSFTPEMVFGVRTGTTAYAERMRISQTGNVGIGTTAPGYLLDLNLGNSGNVRLESGSTYQNGFIASAFSNFLFSNNLYYNGTNFIYEKTGFASQVQTEGSTGNIYLNTFASGTAAGTATPIHSFTLLQNGNVGIGTTGATVMLELHGGTAVVDPPATVTIQTVNFTQGNTQVSSYNSTNTVKVCGLNDGGNYTLILTGYAAATTVTISAFSDTACTVPVNFDFGGSTSAYTSTFTTANNKSVVSFIYSSAIGGALASSVTNFK